MRPLLDWLRNLARPSGPAPPRRPDAPPTSHGRVRRASIVECVTCGRRQARGGAWARAASPVDTQPIYTVCADCAAKRTPK